jgi:hypothetical protein
MNGSMSPTAGIKSGEKRVGNGGREGRCRKATWDERLQAGFQIYLLRLVALYVLEQIFNLAADIEMRVV